ncbi:hypothetical protein [Paenibacillus thiaminolyticus]|nr:hypothetical protein [Paenibacillus thiaminolyticus]
MTTIHQMTLIRRQIEKLGAAYATSPDYRSSLLPFPPIVAYSF